jgi:hypothetical protein
LSLALVALRHLGWQQDEVVYLSQVASHTPALKFTPPRARGLPALLFPFVHFTTGVTAVRSYVSVLGALGLYLGLRPWLKLGYGRVVALAALMFTSLWVATFFGALVQPNYLTATAGAAALGYAMLALRGDRYRVSLVVAALWLALMALLRPSDATWFGVPLVAALLFVRSAPLRRRLAVGAALVGGLALGWSEWVIEAYTSYGGFFHRLYLANQENTPGLHFALGAEARDINGPVLCRPCSSVPVNPMHFAWWFLIPPLVAIGLYGARRSTRLLPLALATLCGTGVLLEYLLTINYASPRFLLTTYLLLALPCAAGAGWLVQWRPWPNARGWFLTGAVAVIVVQFATQIVVTNHAVNHAAVERTRFPRAAVALQAAGVHPPCLLYGHLAPPVAFAMGCGNMPEKQTLVERARGNTVVWLGPPRPGSPYVHGQTVLLGHLNWRGHILWPTVPPS